MSVRSYTKIWIHLIWGTQDHKKILLDKEFRNKISSHLNEYSKSKNIYMKTNYVNADHVHCLIDLPTNKNVEETLQLLKGESSSWINKQITSKFSWAKGYAALSVSESNLGKVVKYIANQEEHHHTKSFTEEYEEFLKLYGINLKG